MGGVTGDGAFDNKLTTSIFVNPLFDRHLKNNAKKIRSNLVPREGARSHTKKDILLARDSSGRTNKSLLNERPILRESKKAEHIRHGIERNRRESVFHVV